MATQDRQQMQAYAPGPNSAQPSRLARPGAARTSNQALPELAALLELVHDSVFVRDLDGRVIYWNRGAEALYGWTAAEATGHAAHALLRTAFPAPLETIHEALLRTGRWEGELRHSRKDGTRIAVASRWAVQRDDRGAPVAVLQADDDISERRRAEQTSPDVEALWRVAFEANPTMYFIVDEEGAIVAVNGFGAHQLGYGPSELVGRPVLDVFHPADRDFVQRKAADCFREPGQPRRWEARKLRKDGSLLWVRETANAVTLKSRPVLLVACEDVTQRRRAEEALRDSEERFRTLVRFSFDVYWETDRQHRFVRQEFGPTAGDAPPAGSELGKTRWEVPYLEPDEEAWRQHRATLDAHLPFRDFELARPTPDGGKRYVSVSGLPVFDDTGAFVGYRGVGRHITERKHAEEMLRTHVWFLESMDRINRAMQGSNNLEQVMSDVLDAVLEVFACDRAWLVYPCDPEAPSWRAVMEHTRPRFPGAFALEADVPLEADVAGVFRAARESDGAVLFGPGSDLRIPGPVADRFAVRSQMVMALRPKVDRAYLFGLHQCSHARVWSEQEKRLFEEIGRRLDDTLTSLLIFRSLRESERKLEEAQRIGHMGYFETDFGTQRLALSDEACRIYGLEQHQLSSWQGRILELVHPEDRTRLVDAIVAAGNGDSRFDVEFRLVRPNGEERIVHSRGEATREAPPRELRAFGTLQDVTELRHAQEELSASELRHRRIFQEASVSIWEEDFSRVEAAIEELRQCGVSDFRGYIAAHPEFVRRAIPLIGIGDVNDATLRLFRARTKEQLLVSIGQVFVPETEASFAEELIALAEGRDSFQGETVLQTLDGERLTVLCAVAFSPRGARSASTLVSIMDITERRRAQQLARHILESTPDGMVVIGRDYRYQRVNPAYENSWKMPAERIVGLHVRDLFGSEFFEQVLRPHLDRCFAGEQVSFGEWFTNARGRFYYSVIYAPLRLGSDHVEAALGITRDLTEHMLASEALRDAEAALARVNRVTTLGVLAASIAHEVNQPLGAMITSAAACARWLASQPPEMDKALSALQRVASDGRRAGQVVDRIRALVNRQAPRRDRVDINEAILEVIALTRDEMRRKAITLHTSLAPDVPPVEGDRVQLQQVVLNLLVNAIDAMSGGGDAARELAVGSAQEGAHAVTVEVRDSGPGVDPRHADRLFEAFYTTKDDGIGMGLSISRSIIEAHGGRLEVTPNAPRGAIFRFSLPVGGPGA